ncbi:hypothetical protein CEXT_371911 [Caerostris extrusa]|uniref:Uncharacterized protein n=1 Tax=Caerostris extrusa TaxID=172846 RepID=A0AAV4SFD4_CAEEX|nr:hypothetical protein CEXT_371911 [Caerostris extrusa]
MHLTCHNLVGEPLRMPSGIRISSPSLRAKHRNVFSITQKLHTEPAILNMCDIQCFSAFPLEYAYIDWLPLKDSNASGLPQFGTSTSKDVF